MDYGSALTAMRNGACVARSGWNGKAMWIARCSISQGRFPSPSGDIDADFLPFTVMRTAQGQFIPWLCSQADADAMDWQIVTD
jgi:hypothetical protein